MSDSSKPHRPPSPSTVRLTHLADQEGAEVPETTPSAEKGAGGGRRAKRVERASLETTPRVRGGSAGARAAHDAPPIEWPSPAPPSDPRSLPDDRLPPVVESPWERYEDLALLGRGGMGEVRRVRDRVLGRSLAMKILLDGRPGSDNARTRFLAEARLAAGLQHPGIVPVHDCGAMPDGRLWFTMKEVRGETLRSAIHAAYAAEPEGLSRAPLRRLVDIYARVCEAVAYAHRHGVVHRDLKPDNVLIGELGEVYVVDWGLARPIDGVDVDAPISANLDERLTLAGQVMGTPAYMPPEQARGEAGIGTRADVYALGAVLYEILCGRAPYSGSSSGVLRLVLLGPPDPIAWRAKVRPPDELLTICERAMARAPEERFPQAGALAAEVRLFFDGARRRDRALAALAEAEALAPKVDGLRDRARALRAEAAALLGALQTWDPAEQKARGWALEDEARALDVAAAVERVAWETKIHVALTESPDLHDAHDALAERYAAELLACERARDVEGAARAEALLRLHDSGHFATLLEGRAAVSLLTEPPGAEVTLLRYVERSRRLVAERVGSIGETPLSAVAVPHGSYLLRVSAPGFRDVRYAVWIGRGEHWDGVPPGGSAPLVIPLLADGELDADDVYVPAGWFSAGGDPSAGDSLAAQRVWVSGFVMRRHPVTVEEYLVFLNDLVAQGRESDALSACPRVPTSLAWDEGALLFARDAGGRFAPLAGAPLEHLRAPVASITWHGAAAYAAWLAARSGRPWRLASELEREKAARGVDGRFFPWGDQAEPTWARMAQSGPGEASAVAVEAYPTDESPYGVRGLAGNVRDWCLDEWTQGGPSVEHGRLRVVPAEGHALRSVRGGAWAAGLPFCRAASRFAARAEARVAALGFRLARSIGGS